ESIDLLRPECVRLLVWRVEDGPRRVLDLPPDILQLSLHGLAARELTVVIVRLMIKLGLKNRPDTLRAGEQVAHRGPHGAIEDGDGHTETAAGAAVDSRGACLAAAILTDFLAHGPTRGGGHHGSAVAADRESAPQEIGMGIVAVA